jgi:glycosyltransferase involved in cell wall biosynthesis
MVHVMNYGLKARALVRSAWDLVHAWEEPYIIAGAQIARWTPRSAALVFATFQNISKRYPPPFNWIERYSLRRATGWVAFGHTALTALGPREGYSDKPHRVIPVGVDTVKFTPDKSAREVVRRALGWLPDGPPVVGYLGRFVPEKGLRVLCDALDATTADWRALFVGGGPLEHDIRAWGAKYGDKVRVITGVPHEKVPAYLNTMDVLAAPSQTLPRWQEQLGRMLIEGFSCGLAVVGSDSGEIPHVLSDAGLVVPEGDVTAWADTLGVLLDSPDRRADLAARGRARAESTYSWPVVARAHLRFFDEVLSSFLPARETM